MSSKMRRVKGLGEGRKEEMRKALCNPTNVIAKPKAEKGKPPSTSPPNRMK
jgi:hypothetical protein